MTYHFAVCDDEPAELDYLEKIVHEWASENGHTARVDRFPSAEAFLFRYAEDKAFDILLLDIEMGAMNGLMLAKEIRRENKEAQIIFVTGYTEYISDGYEVEALHYLIKPVTQEKLCTVLDRAALKLARSGRALLLDIGTESVRVPLYEIRFLEVRRNYVTVHAGEEYTVKATLADMEKGLDDGFFRAGRSFIVNLKFIRKITRTEILLADGSKLPLPRGHYEEIHRAMINRL